MRRIISLVAAALLTACAAVGPDYHRPAAAVVDRGSANAALLGAKHPAFSQDELPARWWRLYDSKPLDDLVQQALAANTDLRAASANIERAATGLDYAEAAERPSAGVQASSAYARRSAEEELKPGHPLPNRFVYGLGANVSYQVDLFGQLARAVEAAQADVDAARAAKELVQVTVVAETTRAYLDLCSAGREIAIAERSIELQKETTELTTKLFRAGRGSELEVTRSSAQQEHTKATLPVLQGQKRLALYRLAVLTGHTPGELTGAVEDCAQEPRLERPIPVGDGAQLLRRRPDIRRAEFDLHGATARIGVATGELYPKITLGASVGSVGLGSHFLDADTVKFSIGPLITWQFPDFGRIHARIKGANAEQDLSLAKFDGTVLSALKETESALEVYARDIERRALLQSARDKAAKAATDSERLFTVGRQGYLTLLDANRTLVSAEQSLAAADTKLASDQVNLFLALGGGWQ